MHGLQQEGGDEGNRNIVSMQEFDRPLFVLSRSAVE